MSNEEIIEKLSKGRVCASMKQTQTPSVWWRRAMILIGLSSFLNACQQRTTGEMTGKIQVDENSHAADTSESFSRQSVKGQLKIRESQTGKNDGTTDTLKSSSEIDSGRLKN